MTESINWTLKVLGYVDSAATLGWAVVLIGSCVALVTALWWQKRRS